MENNTNKSVNNNLSVKDYFDNPIQNKTTVNCLGDVERSDNKGFEPDLKKYLSEKSISEMVQINSEIGKIFKKFKLSVKINMSVLDNLVKNHLPQTRDIALGVADSLPENLQSSVNRKALVKATCLHDIAKVIMPENIINKAGKLTESEREIMKEHSQLSYEMLKNTDLDKETLNLIKNHHENPQASAKSADSVPNLNLQILSIADIYSALREKRCYKAEMTNEQALAIIKEETEQGRFHQSVYDALADYAEIVEKQSAKANSQRKIFNFKPVNGFCS